MGGGARRKLWTVIGIVVVIWAASGIYVVGPGEVGVVRQFGRFVAQTDPGLNYRLPWPVQKADVVNVAEVRRTEIGFRTVEEPGKPATHKRMLEESLMLTGEENIADIQALVHYRVKDASHFLFKVRDPEQALRSATEVALRAVVGNTTIDHAMTVGRPQIEADTRIILQELLDDYQTGLHVVELKLLVVDPPDEVKDAFHEVVRALEDKQRFIKEAEGYAEKVVPEARGNAEKEIRAAEAYKQERVLLARGDAARFLKVLEEYRKAVDVTRQRLYLETIERVLADTEKIIIDPEVSGHLMPFLPLAKLTEGEKPGEAKE
jgi:membrane protease subunit HflK